jgi:hypothetical protein
MMLILFDDMGFLTMLCAGTLADREGAGSIIVQVPIVPILDAERRRRTICH